MPNVVGKKATDAEKILADAGFTNVKFVGEDGKDLTLLVSWKVVKQSVKAGTKVAADTEIILTNTSVSNGKG
ncbi:PASTA domain-containing protein [Catellatospora coxensis]